VDSSRSSTAQEHEIEQNIFAHCFPFEVEIELFEKTQKLGETFKLVLDEFNKAFSPRGFAIVCEEPQEYCSLYMSKKSGKAKTDYPSKQSITYLFLEINIEKEVSDFNFNTATLVVPEAFFVKIGALDK